MGCKLLVVACGIQFPNQGLNLGPLHWDPGVLAMGPPGKSPTLVLVSSLLFKLIFFNVYHFSNKSHKNINKIKRLLPLILKSPGNTRLTV